MSLQFPYKAQHRFSSRSKPATCDTLFQETSCLTSWTVHEVSLRSLWLRIQCSLVELGLPASMTSERIHPCILLTSHSFVILENRTRCSITVCLHPLKPKRKEMLKTSLWSYSPPFYACTKWWGKAMSRGVSERKQLIEPACPAVETFYSVHIEIQLF